MVRPDVTSGYVTQQYSTSLHSSYLNIKVSSNKKSKQTYDPVVLEFLLGSSEQVRDLAPKLPPEVQTLAARVLPVLPRPHLVDPVIRDPPGSRCTVDPGSPWIYRTGSTVPHRGSPRCTVDPGSPWIYRTPCKNLIIVSSDPGSNF